MPQPRKEKYSNIDGNVEIWSMKTSFDLYISKRTSTNRGQMFPFCRVANSNNGIIPIFIYDKSFLVIRQKEIFIPFIWVLKLLLIKVVAILVQELRNPQRWSSFLFLFMRTNSICFLYLTSIPWCLEITVCRMDTGLKNSNFHLLTKSLSPGKYSKNHWDVS